jgi:signal transduction histidine kinase
MTTGGTLTVSTRVVGADVEVVVSSAGTGMNDAVIRRCGGLLSTTKESRGTGIGFATTKATAERHGGTIAPETAAGNEATFTVRLPLSHVGVQSALGVLGV